MYQMQRKAGGVYMNVNFGLKNTKATYTLTRK